MPVTDITPRTTFDCTGGTEYAFTWKFAAQTDLLVQYYLDDDSIPETLILDALTDGFTATEPGTGGTITTTETYSTGAIVVQRDMEQIQEYDLQNHASDNMQRITDALDRCVMLIQQFKSDIDLGALVDATSVALEAAASATSASDDADDAEAALAAAEVILASITLPSMSGATALDAIRVNAAKTAYEFFQTYTETEIDALFAALTAGYYTAYVKVSDVKTAGTDGGSFGSGSWVTRTINTKDSDAQSICSIASNQITLPAGSYRCMIKCPAWNVEENRADLYNPTTAVTLVEGTSERASYDPISSYICGRFVLAAETALEIRHFCAVTQSVNGFGRATNFSTEVYTVAEFWKEA